MASVCVFVCGVCGRGAENLISNSSAPKSADLPRGDWLSLPGVGWAAGGVTAGLRAPPLWFPNGILPRAATLLPIVSLSGHILYT